MFKKMIKIIDVNIIPHPSGIARGQNPMIVSISVQFYHKNTVS